MRVAVDTVKGTSDNIFSVFSELGLVWASKLLGSLQKMILVWVQTIALFVADAWMLKASVSYILS